MFERCINLSMWKQLPLSNSTRIKEKVSFCSMFRHEEKKHFPLLYVKILSRLRFITLEFHSACLLSSSRPRYPVLPPVTDQQARCIKYITNYNCTLFTRFFNQLNKLFIYFKIRIIKSLIKNKEKISKITKITRHLAIYN